MDEYSFDIECRTERGAWAVKDNTQKVTAYSQTEAEQKANTTADGLYGGTGYKVRNVRMTKRFNNPDGEI